MLVCIGQCVLCCAVPVGNLPRMLFQEGRSSNFRLRRGVEAANARNNHHVKFIGVYCA